METQSQTGPRIIRSIDIPVDGKEVQFVQPIIGPNTYKNVGREILKLGLEIPTGKELALFLDACYNNSKIADSPEAERVRQAMNESWVWDFAVNLYTPNGPENERGIFVVRDAKAEGLDMKLNSQELISKLDSKYEVNGVKFNADRSISFVPETTYLNKQFNSSNGYLIARGQGSEGAEALVRVSKNETFRNAGSNYLVDISKSEVKKVSALDGYGGGRLGVGGSWYVDGGCFAFGVKRSGEIVQK